jgi:RimJ/RimL family protein N-acetyltransferase
MLIEVPPERREQLRPLFAGTPGVRGVQEAGLSGAMGRMYADDLDDPKLAVLNLWFYMAAGEPTPDAVYEFLHLLPMACSIIVPEDWHAVLQKRCPDHLTPEHRTLFRAAEWDRSQLARFRAELPPGFLVSRIDAGNVERFAQFDRSFAGNYGSADAFLEHGAGFGVEHRRRFVSGCTSFASGGGALEFEIDTHPDFRRRGLATAGAAAMIEYCLERGIAPCWDAMNYASAQLAQKLGFREPQRYVAYYVHPVPIEEP